MNTKKVILLTAVAMGLVARALVCGLCAADNGKTDVRVEVLIFSGRPNPAWHLQDSTWLEALKSRLKDLPEAFKEEPVEWSRLGFAGFRIRGGEALGVPGEIRVYQGVIKTGQGKQAQYWKDSKGLEQSLIAEANRQALEPAVKEAIAGYEKARNPAP